MWTVNIPIAVSSFLNTRLSFRYNQISVSIAYLWIFKKSKGLTILKKFVNTGFFFNIDDCWFHFMNQKTENYGIISVSVPGDFFFFEMHCGQNVTINYIIM